MPIYLYQCDSCGMRFERVQRMSDDPLTDCPECDGHVHRVIQPVGVIFRGSGFYITDNRQVSSPTLAPAKEDKSEAKTTADVADAKKDESGTKTTADAADAKKAPSAPAEK